MGVGGLRTRKAWRIGSRKEADYLVMARIHDAILRTLIEEFPGIVRSASGEAREPHVTLFGPFHTHEQGERFLDLIRNLASGLDCISCTIGAPVALKGMRGGAVALGLTPGPGLSSLYQGLVEQIPPVATRCTWIDVPPGRRIFHISLRINIPFREFECISSALGEFFPPLPSSPGGGEADTLLGPSIPGPGTHLVIDRIALLRRGTLWKELDLTANAWVPRREAIGTGPEPEGRRREGIEDSPDQKNPADSGTRAGLNRPQ